MELVKRLSRVKKPVFIGVSAAVLAIIVLIVFLVVRANALGQETSTTVQSATAQKGSVSSTVTGTGSLASGTTTDVVVPAEIKVESVSVESGDAVVVGQELATLNQASVASALLSAKEELEDIEEEIDSLSSSASDTSSTEYLEALVLEEERKDLETTVSNLTALLDNPVITANVDGTVGSVNVSAGSETSASSTSSSSSSSSSGSGSSSSGSSGSVSTSTTTTTSGDGMTSTASYQLGSSDAKAATSQIVGACTSWANLVYDETALTTALQLVLDDATITMASGGTAVSNLSLNVDSPVVGQTPQTALGNSDIYDSSLSWNCSTDVFQEDTVYTATIKLVAKEGYTFFEDIVPEVKGATVVSTVLSSDDGRSDSVVLIKAQFAKTGSVDGSGAGSNSSNSSSSGVGTKSSSSSTESSGSTSNGASSGSSSQGTSSGTTSSSTESGSSSGTDSSDSEFKEATAFTIVSDTDATVSISVDEADILSVKKGQDVTVSFDAVEGREFDGTITKVSDSTSSSSSGSTKYTATVTMDKTDDMMFGMSASATIQISESDDAVVLPVSALQERGSSSFVYTQLDSDGNPSGEVEVEAGLSNGSQVEITSGLSEGDTVYYTKTESSSKSTDSGMGTGGSGMFGSGEMPNGGEMPSGGSGGGEMPSGGSSGGFSGSRQSQ